MHDILDADELRKTADYISKLPDNTNGKELIDYAANICREINGETVQSTGA